MASSIEQKIIDAIVTRLRTILIANGYATSIGTTVFDSQPNLDQGDDLPAISVFEGPVVSMPDHTNRRQVVRTMPVIIRAFFERADTSVVDAAYARNVLKDIHKAILGSGTSLNGYLAERFPTVEGTKPGNTMDTVEKSHHIEYADGTYEITGCVVEIETTYISGKFNLEAT